MAQAVFCLAQTEAQAIMIVDQLRAAGFSSNDISVLFPDTTGTKDFAHEQHTKVPEGTATGAGTGGVLGGALGWLVSSRLLRRDRIPSASLRVYDRAVPVFRALDSLTLPFGLSLWAVGRAA